MLFEFQHRFACVEHDTNEECAALPIQACVLLDQFSNPRKEVNDESSLNRMPQFGRDGLGYVPPGLGTPCPGVKGFEDDVRRSSVFEPMALIWKANVQFRGLKYRREGS
jgi:hypothetical protein